MTPPPSPPFSLPSHVLYGWPLIVLLLIELEETSQPFKMARKRGNLNEIVLKIKGYWKREYELFSLSFLGFEIGANRFSIKFCIRKSNLFSSNM